MMKVWQIAAGDEGRDYSGLFLEYDLMSVGPSYPGSFDRAVYEKAAETNERLRGFRGT